MAHLRFVPNWLAERADYPHISLQTLALTEAITDGHYAQLPAAQLCIDELLSAQRSQGIIRGFFKRWYKRQLGALPS